MAPPRIVNLPPQRQRFRRAQRQQLLKFSLTAVQRLFSSANLLGILRMLPHMIEHRRFQPSETKVQRVPFHFRRTKFHPPPLAIPNPARPPHNRPPPAPKPPH